MRATHVKCLQRNEMETDRFIMTAVMTERQSEPAIKNCRGGKDNAYLGVSLEKEKLPTVKSIKSE